MSDLTEAFYARLYSFYRPTSDFSYNPKQPRDKTGKWTSAKGAGGPSKTTAEPTNDKLWTGVSAHPDRRVKPTPTIGFPPAKKDDYESRKEANRRFAESVYATDLGNGYHSKVTQIEDHGRDGMTVRGVLVYKGREIGTFDRNFATEKNGRVISVDHTELMINPTHRSKGLADRFNAHAVAKYQEMGVDRITLHAGDEVGGFAWARQGFRFANYDARRMTVETALRAIDADIKYDPKLRADPAMKKQIEDEVFAVRRRMEERPDDVQPIHIASIGERHKWQSEHEISGPYTNWPGKRAMMRSSWEGVYYFDASKAVTAAATDLEHGELRPQFKESTPPKSRPQRAVDAAMRMIRQKDST